MMGSDRTRRESGPTRVDDAVQSSRALWQRIPKGWIVLALVILAWLAAYLIFRGMLFLIG